jgi:hypothetical protein
VDSTDSESDTDDGLSPLHRTQGRAEYSVNGGGGSGGARSVGGSGDSGKDYSITIQGSGIHIVAYASSKRVQQKWLTMLQNAAAGRLPVRAHRLLNGCQYHDIV